MRVFFLPGLLAAGLLFSNDAYRAEVEGWRRHREASLRADDGWLTVAGLFWLREGANSFGSDPSCDLVLPPGSAPPRAGTFQFHGGRIEAVLHPGVRALHRAKPVTRVELKPDTAGGPDVLNLNDLSLFVIQRGDRFGIRLRDKNSRFRRAFRGLQWFPVQENARVMGRFSPYHPPQRVAVPSVIGITEEMISPGIVEFFWKGQAYQLEPVLSENRLLFVFRDLSAGTTTYPSGRFLSADMPEGGLVILDFNKAYNPPCAFTPYATCPLPPRRNHLPVPIEAGEKRYHHDE